MAGAPFWGLNDQGASSNEGRTYAIDPWDSFIIADMTMPGICKVRGTPAVFSLIVKKRKGANGARQTFDGYFPKTFEVQVEIFTEVQWELFQEICDELLRLKSGVVPKGTDFVFDVRHPDLARIHVHQATMTEMPLGEDGSVEGSKIFRFRFQEYYPDQGKNVTKSATASVSVVKELRFKAGSEPSNAPPPAPSSNKKNLRLKGPPPQAAE